MATDLVNMHKKRIKYPKNVELTDNISVYLKIAERAIYKMCPSLISEDSISNVATAVMLGDWRWNGLGSKSGYRNKCAKWAALNLIARTKNNSPPLKSLNHPISLQRDKILEFGDTIVKDAPSYLLVHQLYECLEKLKPIEQQCIKLYYMENMKMQSIADDIGLTKQRVHQHIGNGLATLRRLME